MSHFVKLDKPSTWRRLARAGWGSPTDPSIHGFVDVDMTNALKFIEDVRQLSGERVTITHLVSKAIAMAIREYPLLNGVIRWDGFYLRKTIDIFVLAARDREAISTGGGLSGVKITQADHRSVADIARLTQQKVKEVVQHTDKETEPTEKMLGWLPDWLIKPVMGCIDFLSYELDLDGRKLGLPYDQFGTAVITNVGMLGLSNGFAPIFPPTRCPLVIAVGEVRQEAMVIDGKVRVRPCMTLGCTVDHRFIDGLGAGRMSRRFRELLADPAAHFMAEVEAETKRTARRGSGTTRGRGKVRVVAARAGKKAAKQAEKKVKPVAVRSADAKPAARPGAPRPVPAEAVAAKVIPVRRATKRTNGSAPPEPPTPAAA